MRRLRITLRYVPIAAVLTAVGFLSLGARAAVERLTPGTYETTITAQDIPPSFPPEATDILVGHWQIEFTETGTAFVTKDGELVVITRYLSNPARLILHDEEGRLACTPSAAGVFAWAIQQNELTVTEVHDTCAGRALVMTAHPLQKVQ